MGLMYLKLRIRFFLFASLGILGAGFHYLDFPNEVYYWLIENIYYEQLEYIENGSGGLHWLYCKFIMISEGI